MSASNVDSIALALIENNPIRQFVANPNSRVVAIKAKCAECMGCTPDHMERGFRASISSCSSYSCPLHRFRPYQREKSLEGQKTAVQNL
jgi:hypothetical protein